MKPPSAAAIGIMNNGGKVPGALAQPQATQLAGAAGTAPVTTPVPTPTPAPTVVQSTATPVPTIAPVQTAVPGTGASAAPQG
jgi:hypothetical protein